MTYLCWKMAGGVGRISWFPPTSAIALPHAATGTIVCVLLIFRDSVIVPVETHDRASRYVVILLSSVRYTKPPLLPSAGIFGGDGWGDRYRACGHICP